MKSVPFITTIRSGVVETIHRISAVVIQDGKIILSYGNPDLIVLMRSTAKPFMLVPLLKSLINCGMTLTDAQLCIMASSHNGEKIHRDVVKSILLLANKTTYDLHCGTHFPYYEWLYEDYFKTKTNVERQLFNNCSGKHAGLLLLCKLREISSDQYWIPEHPIQQEITSSIKNLLNIDVDDYFSLGVDGCGVPTYCTSLTKIANLYQRFPFIPELSDVFNSIINEPFLLAGKERIDTLLSSIMQIIAKSGSDGLFCASLPQQRIGIALKIESGSDEAAESAIVELLHRMELLSPEILSMLEHYWHFPIMTTTGLNIGNYMPIGYEISFDVKARRNRNGIIGSK